MDVRMNHLRPTMFVAAVPELADARTRREDAEALRSAEDQPDEIGGEDEGSDPAAWGRYDLTACAAASA